MLGTCSHKFRSHMQVLIIALLPMPLLLVLVWHQSASAPAVSSRLLQCLQHAGKLWQCRRKVAAPL